MTKNARVKKLALQLIGLVLIALLSQAGPHPAGVSLPQLRRTPLGHGDYATVNPIYNPSLNENRYIGFGDSITYGTINHDYHPELGYIPRLDALLDAAFGPTEVVNEGVGGEETSQGDLRIGTVIALRQARYILIMEGTNDVTFMRSVSNTIVYLRSMILKCQGYGLLPVLATIVPRRDAAWSLASRREIHNSLNAAIRLLALETKVPLADMDLAFNGYQPGGPEALLSEDLKHPNETGYQVMAGVWAEAIKAVPFAPVQVRSVRDADKIMFSRRPGVMVTWQPNAKTAAGVVSGYRIYRRKKGEDALSFRLMAQVVDVESWFDSAAASGTVYEYAVSAVREDGVEGPCSSVSTLENSPFP